MTMKQQNLHITLKQQIIFYYGTGKQDKYLHNLAGVIAGYEIGTRQFVLTRQLFYLVTSELQRIDRETALKKLDYIFKIN